MLDFVALFFLSMVVVGYVCDCISAERRLRREARRNRAILRVLGW